MRKGTLRHNGWPVVHSVKWQMVTSYTCNGLDVEPEGILNDVVSNEIPFQGQSSPVV